MTKLLAINAEPRRKEHEPRKRLGRHTLHSQESGRERRRQDEQTKGTGRRQELQSACMLVSMKAREKEYEEFLSYQGEQVWKEMSEEVAAIPDGKKEESPAV